MKNNNPKEVLMYTDGAAKGNPGPGGYGVVLIYKDQRKEFSQGYRLTTNNRMELLAIITGLEALKMKCNVNIYSDSKYVVDAISNKWIYKWAKDKWKRKDNISVSNTDLWKQLMPLLRVHHITIHWVKGHADTEENKRCDLLANAAAESKNLHIDEIFESNQS